MRLTVLTFLWFLCITWGAELTLLHTSDTHGCCGKEERNWLKLATIIRQEIQQRGKENTLLIDTGDVVQGTQLASLTKGKATFLPITLLPYDVFVPGNHEFDFGINAYIRFCRKAGDKLLAANLRIKEEPEPAGWRLFERSGIRVAVIGLQASYYANWLLPQDAARCDIESGISALERMMPEVCNASPDVIILATHQGWTEAKADPRGVNEVAAIAERFPEIDVILGGHTHRSFPGRKIGAKSWYVQPDPYGESLGIVTIQLEQKKIKNITSELRKVETAGTDEDIELKAALANYWIKEEEELKRPTGIFLTKEISSSGKAGRGCQTSQLLCKALLKVTKADIALHNKLNDYSLFRGTVTTKQLFRLVPYENTIVVALVTQKQLEDILAEQETHKNTYRYAEACNITTIPGKKPRIISIGGRPPAADKLYLLAVNSHLAAGSGYFPVLRQILSQPEAKTRNTKISVRKAVERYLYNPAILEPPQLIGVSTH